MPKLLNISGHDKHEFTPPVEYLELILPSGVEIEYHARLSDYTTFQLGGKCKAVVTCRTPGHLENVIKQFIEKGDAFILIGRGSNLLVSDYGLDCFVIRYISDTPEIERRGDDLIVPGCTLLDALSEFAADNGLEGIGYATGIPGTVGGAVAGNAGAFGRQTGDIIKSAVLLTVSGAKKEVNAGYFCFNYRDSILKRNGDIVLSARIGLKAGDKKELQKQRAEILNIRKNKHPDWKIDPCAGSFFRNIEPSADPLSSATKKRLPAAWFLEHCGAKGLKYGGASVFKGHANIIIKSGDCCSLDVVNLSQKMSEKVKKKFNIDLIREVLLVGKFDGKKSTAIV